MQFWISTPKLHIFFKFDIFNKNLFKRNHKICAVKTNKYRNALTAFGIICTAFFVDNRNFPHVKQTML